MLLIPEILQMNPGELIHQVIANQGRLMCRHTVEAQVPIQEKEGAVAVPAVEIVPAVAADLLIVLRAQALSHPIPGLLLQEVVLQAGQARVQAQVTPLAVVLHRAAAVRPILLQVPAEVLLHLARVQVPVRVPVQVQLEEGNEVMAGLVITL